MQRYILISILKTKRQRKKSWKWSEKNNTLSVEKNWNKMIADFTSKMLEARKKWTIFFKQWKKRIVNLANHNHQKYLSGIKGK